MNIKDPQTNCSMTLAPPEQPGMTGFLDNTPYTSTRATNTTNHSRLIETLTNQKTTGVLLLICFCLATVSAITTTQCLSCRPITPSDREIASENQTTTKGQPITPTSGGCETKRYTAYLGDDITVSLCYDQNTPSINIQKLSGGIMIDVSLAERLSYILEYIIENEPNTVVVSV